MKYFVDVNDTERTREPLISFNDRSVFINFGEGRVVAITHPEVEQLMGALAKNHLEMERAKRLLLERRTREGRTGEA